MATFFRKPDRRQRFLLPVDMLDWLPESDFVHLVLDAVEQMDLSGFEAEYRTGGAGQAPFAPAMMLAVLIYAYANGHRSSRKVERLCWRDVGFRMIVGDQVPDHSVIARFRRRHAERVEAVFVAVLRLCRAAGLARLGVVALDGTKVAANAALAANRTAKTIDEEVAAILAEAEAIDVAEDAIHGELRGDELPAALRRREDRLARLLAAKERLARDAAERAAAQQAKVEARAAEEAATGQRKRGRKPSPPSAEVDPQAKANPTDPDSGIMKTAKGWVQGDNAQAMVTEDQIIIAGALTRAPGAASGASSRRRVCSTIRACSRRRARGAGGRKARATCAAGSGRCSSSCGSRIRRRCSPATCLTASGNGWRSGSCSPTAQSSCCSTSRPPG